MRRLEIMVGALTIKRNRNVCLVTFALCSFSFPPALLSQAAGPSAIQPADDRVLRAVVQLVAVGPGGTDRTRQCTATGFLIDEEGYLITNAHVVDDSRQCLEKAPGAKILARLSGGNSSAAQAIPVDVVALDEANDLALLKTERPLAQGSGEQSPYAELDARPTPVGTPVTVSGHPASAWQPVTQTGQVIRTGMMRLEEINDPRTNRSDAVEINVQLKPGSSGSPVYRSGGVIAVVDKRDALRPEYSVAVAIHYVIELAERNHAPWHGAD